LRNDRKLAIRRLERLMRAVVNDGKNLVFMVSFRIVRAIARLPNGDAQ